MVLPFVIPFMVSGPDYTFHNKLNRWRRRDGPRFQVAPEVTPNHFLTGFARRCESQCRQDWTALSLMRGVVFRDAVETWNTMMTVPQWWVRGQAVNLSAKEHAKMIEKLYVQGTLARSGATQDIRQSDQRRYDQAPSCRGLDKNRKNAC